MENTRTKTTRNSLILLLTAAIWGMAFVSQSKGMDYMHPFTFNGVRSLIGAFAGSNPAAFHAEDGSGYQFLVEMLTELNQRNPQVASRLIEPLIRLKRYDEKRQALMRAALEQLKGLENLSGDLFEKISKALA